MVQKQDQKPRVRELGAVADSSAPTHDSRQETAAMPRRRGRVSGTGTARTRPGAKTAARHGASARSDMRACRARTGSETPRCGARRRARRRAIPRGQGAVHRAGFRVPDVDARPPRLLLRPVTARILRPLDAAEAHARDRCSGCRRLCRSRILRARNAQARAWGRATQYVPRVRREQLRERDAVALGEVIAQRKAIHRPRSARDRPGRAARSARSPELKALYELNMPVIRNASRTKPGVGSSSGEPRTPAAAARPPRCRTASRLRSRSSTAAAV